MSSETNNTKNQNSKVKQFICENRFCRAVLCYSDGTALFADANGTEKLNLNRQKQSQKVLCQNCGSRSRWYKKRMPKP